MKIGNKITAIALLWLIFVNSGLITSADTFRRLGMSHAWWTGTEELVRGNTLIVKVNDKKYIPYDLGQSMLMLPGDWLGEHLGKGFENELVKEHFREIVVSFLIFIPINLLTILTCFRFLCLLNYSETIAGLSSLVWLIRTSVLFYSSFHQQNNQILLFVLVSYQAALMYVLKNQKLWAILSGAALGFAFIIRITNILYVASILTFLVGCILSQERTKQRLKSVRSVLLWTSGFIPFVLLERVLSYVRYGSWRATSVSLHLQIYNKVDTLANSSAVVEGVTQGFPFIKLLTKVQPEALFAPLFSPEKSIFIYDPLLLPCLILLIICWKFLSQYIKWYAIATIIGFLLHLYIYSWTFEWIDQVEWGARYHVTSIHLLLIPLIPLLVKGAIEQTNINGKFFQKILILIAKIVLIMAVLIQFTSIILPPGLEAHQKKLNIGSKFYVKQRISNVFYMLDPNPNFQISELEQNLTPHSLDSKVIWNLLPFRYQNKIQPYSYLKKFIPMLFIAWSIIFIAAISTTIWIFIE